MSKYQIPAIADEDLDMAASAEIGAEVRVFRSFDALRLVAEIELDQAGNGIDATGATLVLDKAYKAPTAIGSGRDLALVTLGPVLSPTEDIDVVLNVQLNGLTVNISTIGTGSPGIINTVTPHGLTNGQTVTIAAVVGGTPVINGNHIVTVTDTDTFTIPVNITVAGTGGTVSGPERVGTATATLKPSATAFDDSFNLPPGLAVDFTTSIVGSTVRSIVDIESVDGASAGARFAVIAIPDDSTFKEIACTEGKDIDLPTPQSIAIACRYNAARWVKKARSNVPNFGFKAKYTSYGDGLMRLNGHRVTVRLDTRKDDRILSERMFIGGWRPIVKLTRPEGEGESMVESTGMFETVAVFV